MPGGGDVDDSYGARRGSTGAGEQDGQEQMGEKEVGEVVCLFCVSNRGVREEDWGRYEQRTGFRNLEGSRNRVHTLSTQCQSGFLRQEQNRKKTYSSIIY